MYPLRCFPQTNILQNYGQVHYQEQVHICSEQLISC